MDPHALFRPARNIPHLSPEMQPRGEKSRNLGKMFHSTGCNSPCCPFWKPDKWEERTGEPLTPLVGLSGDVWGMSIEPTIQILPGGGRQISRRHKSRMSGGILCKDTQGKWGSQIIIKWWPPVFKITDLTPAEPSTSGGAWVNSK
jgi:hypothetical protein